VPEKSSARNSRFGGQAEKEIDPLIEKMTPREGLFSTVPKPSDGLLGAAPIAAPNLLYGVLPQIGPRTSMVEKKLPTTSSPAVPAPLTVPSSAKGTASLRRSSAVLQRQIIADQDTTMAREKGWHSMLCFGTAGNSTRGNVSAGAEYDKGRRCSRSGP
jgi:hypothetical protein